MEEAVSYPSIRSVLLEQGFTDPETAHEDVLRSALWSAFRHDLPLGVAFLEREASEVLATSKRKLTTTPPDSPLGRQLIRLVGCDVSRSVCEEKLGVAMGLYNCCSTVLGPSREALQMTTTEQINLQNGVLASADC
ncbi:MAG: hypothetical protein WDN47_04865 [Candidatus Doudnabacteria bacterium]